MEGQQQARVQQDRAMALEALKERRRPQPNTNSDQQVQPMFEPSPSTGAEQCRAAPPTSAQPKRMRCLVWKCKHCTAVNGNGECLPIRSESRCLCGHRLKDHVQLSHAETADTEQKLKCTAARCNCADFFYIVAEGSWILRCSCKHKHTDHDALTHACSKPACNCARFHSPWVCNCDHPWADHEQVIVEREVKSLEQLGAELCVATDVNRHDLIQRGLAG